jgi:transcriptional regulator with XRE-family HTH domain
MVRKRVVYQNVDLGTMNLIYSEIGRRIKEARVSKGFTQRELSDRVKLSRTSITNLEKGFQKITLHTLFEVSLALDVGVYSLLPSGLDEIS